MSSYELEHHPVADEDVVHVSVSGELDLTNARDVAERLDELAPPGALLVLDVNRVVFIDSAALNTVFTIARARGPGRLGLMFEPTAPIARALDVVRIDQVVGTGSSVDEIRRTLQAT